MRHQNLINELHIAFKEQVRTEDLQQWDSFIAAVVRKNFPEEQAEIFFEAQGTLLAVFANDLIAFIIDYFTEEEEN
ncbi:hypothetical protein STRDD10_01580 [Streptococcus sp. DD10]|uniref:hypothetical protein n=1 Tax=Streptococcus sp. DD10 TaxID=1777878 RepID=UPI0007999DA8|nr:hypothetical protein [Streptococcus sp. DD10]KXT73325.1 hypothetical protein STRDD10_01580 [Streptococcus sp. DD10]